MFVGTAIDDEIANLVVAQLLHLEAEDPEKEIQLYVNSPGGLVYAGLAIYDTMRFIKPDVATTCCGIAMSMGSLILAGGAHGSARRCPTAASSSTSQRGFQGQSTDIAIHAKESLALRRRMEEIYAEHTGRDRDVSADLERDRFFTPSRPRVRADRPRDPLRNGNGNGAADGAARADVSPPPPPPRRGTRARAGSPCGRTARPRGSLRGRRPGRAA